MEARGGGDTKTERTRKLLITFSSPRGEASVSCGTEEATSPANLRDDCYLWRGESVADKTLINSCDRIQLKHKFIAALLSRLNIGRYC